MDTSPDGETTALNNGVSETRDNNAPNMAEALPDTVR